MGSEALLGRRDVAKSFAADAASIAMSYWQGGRIESTAKASPLDLVTQADLDVEGFIVNGLREQFPDDGFVAEEQGGREGSSGFSWTVDPIDGTANFVLGIAHWCVSIGCLYEGQSVVGAIYDPVADEMFSAASGHGSWLGEDRVDTSVPTLPVSTWAIGLSEDISTSRRMIWEETIRPLLGRVRAMGSLALDLAWTAAGRFDAFFYECGLRPWDYGAGEIICREAGLDVIRVRRSTRYSAALVALPASWRNELHQPLSLAHLLGEDD